MKVKDKIAIVTGGAQGLGRGFAEGLLKNGASIVIADVKTDVGRQTEADLNNQYEGNRCTFIKCDVTDKDELKSVMEIPQNPVYAASKHGVVGLTRSLGARQEDVVGQGLRFCCLCPTLVRTPMIENVIDEVAWAIEKYGMLEVSQMVDVFLKVVDNDDLHAAAIVITPQTGAVVQFPDNLKGTKL